MTETVFDKQKALNFVTAKKDTLGTFIDRLSEKPKTAIDLGCSVGFFSQFLHERGIETLGIDGRDENVVEARKRFPRVSFEVGNVENTSIQLKGSFDLVLAVGLMYHLENPFQAIRNIFALTKNVAFIETVVAPSEKQAAFLYEEGVSASQGLNYMALIPTLPTFVKMLYRAGFKEVYDLQDLPNNPEFHRSRTGSTKRRIIVASRQSISLPAEYRLYPEPKSVAKPSGTRFGIVGHVWAYIRKQW